MRDRDGPLMPPELVARGRADHRARRVSADSDSRAAAEASARDGHVDDLRHPRSRGCGADRRPGRRHVCGTNHRIRDSKRRASDAPASLHARDAGLDLERSGERRSARGYSWQSAGSSGFAAWLQLRAALRVCRSRMHRRRSPADLGPTRAYGAMCPRPCLSTASWPSGRARPFA